MVRAKRHQRKSGESLRGKPRDSGPRLATKLKTNRERFEELCRVLEAGPLSDVDREAEVHRLITEIDRYRFVGESCFSVALIIEAVNRAVKGLMDLQIPLSKLDVTCLSTFLASSAEDELVALEALSEIHSHPTRAETSKLAEPERLVWMLVEAAWMYTFQSYFHLKEKTSGKSSGGVQKSPHT